MRSFGFFAGVDSGQLFGISARATQIAAGLVTMLLVSIYFDPHTQGYFYTFGSLIALQVLAEVGLGTVLLQFVSHEMANLRWRGQNLEGETRALVRIRSIVKFAIIWFGIGVIALIVILIFVGEIFFKSPNQTAALEGIWVAWIILVVATAVSLFVTAMISLIEGTGRVAEVNAVRLIQHFLGGVTAWFAIVLGLGLIALAVQAIVVATTGIAYLFSKRMVWKSLLRLTEKDHTFSWRNEIWPFQWRLAVSWLCGYFTFQAFTPAVFLLTGPEEAGRMGMSMQIFSAISSIAIIFVSARSSTFGQLVSSRQASELNKTFRISLIHSIAMLTVLLIMLLAALFTGITWNLQVTSRLLPFTELGILAAAILGNHLVSALAIYLRAHKQEPFMMLSVLSAVLMATVSFWSISNFGTTGAALTYAGVTLLVSLPLGSMIFKRFREARVHVAIVT